MDFTTVFCVGVATVLVIYIWRISNYLWFKPKKTEKFLRKQGLKGSSYTFMFGDLKEMVQMMTEARAKPMSLTHDITPRVSPFFHKSLAAYGKSCFTWMGIKPVVHICEPAMVREVLANYTKYQKPRGGNPLAKLLAKGLIDAEADHWVKHRKIINPAFHVEKLKVSCSSLISICYKMITFTNSSDGSRILS